MLVELTDREGNNILINAEHIVTVQHYSYIDRARPNHCYSYTSIVMDNDGKSIGVREKYDEVKRILGVKKETLNE